MNPPYNQPSTPLNLKSLRTRFALRFLRALKKINYNHQQNNNNGFMVSQRYHRVKVAADVSMASVVGPRRAWSRAILLRARPMYYSHNRQARVKREIVRRKKIRARQAEELRQLVPGGEDMDLQSLLDETAHYIKCLNTQVKVMRSIVNYCSTS